MKTGRISSAASVIGLICFLFSLLPASRSQAISIFEASLGWKSDVDLVAAPDGEFLVICEQSNDDLTARVRIMNLDPATGEPLGITQLSPVPGFEIGVDPIVVPELGFNLGYPVFVPVESADGMDAGVLLLLVDDTGAASYEEFINLDDLGFRTDVDGIFWQYAGPVVIFFPLENPGGDVRGVLAIDADPRPNMGAPGVGTCTLLSTDGRALCDLNVAVDWLPNLAYGVDPVAYEIINCCSRLALPVTGAAGSDLLLIDFDPNVPAPPAFLGHASVKSINALGLRPTDFPGWEWDVDIRLFPQGGCGALPINSMLVPVEGPGDVADVYTLDEDGNAIWVLSLDGAAGGVEPFGFEKGVDLLPLCGIGGSNPNQLLVPLENSAGTDADVWFVDMSNGALLASVEDANAGLTIEGFEIGIDAIHWREDRSVVAVENLAGHGRLLAFDGNASLMDETSFPQLPGDWGFHRSVDMVTANVSPPQSPLLYVPLEMAGDPEETAVLGYEPSGFASVLSLEAINPGLEFGELVTDLDPGVVYPLQPGQAWIYLPEEDPDGLNARLRFEFVPVTAGEPTLIVATKKTAAVDASLKFFWAAFGGLILSENDVLGLETGMDLANGRGSVTPHNQPYDFAEPGYDQDSDPTLADETISTAVNEPTFPGETQVTGQIFGRMAHGNPLQPPVVIKLSLKESADIRADIYDFAGRHVRHLLAGARPAGELVLGWDGYNERGFRAGAGVYFVKVSGAGESRSSKFVLLR